jgi:hypothetical protein
LDALTALSELKLYIRDEHIGLSHSKERLKRHFGKASTTPTQATQPSTGAATSNVETTEVQSTNEPLPTEATGPTGFRAIANRHTEQVQLDDTDNEPVRVPEFGVVKVSELFDFSQKEWVEKYARSSLRNFEEELELYELLDLDAAGEEEVDIGVDESTADILVGQIGT